MLRERTKRILKAGISDFINTGQPITSERLSREYDFGIKSAMIRWELHALSNNGYLYQSHTSSGRFPSDKAYRFFVSNILKELEKEPGTDFSEEVIGIIECLKEGAKKKFVRDLADTLKTLNLYYELEHDVVYRSGLNDFFSCFDTITKQEVIGIAEDLEFLPEKLESERGWWQDVDDWPQVFIGKSPITRSRNLSVIVNRIPTPGRNICLIVAIGPKRTNYEKSIKLFKSLNHLAATKY